MAKLTLRAITVIGKDARIPLTQGQTAIVDAADLSLVDGVNWKAVKFRDKFYAMAWIYAPGTPRRGVLLHRHILGASPDVQVDHADLDGLNCRRNNLRAATRAQNQWNTSKRAGNSSGFKGVFRHGNKWRARISFDGKQRHLGIFDTAEKAHEAVIQAAAQNHGDFARA